MNPLIRALLLLTAASLPAFASPNLIAEAQRDYNAGRYGDAKAKFLQVQAENPSNAIARNYLRLIATAEQQATRSELRTQLSRLVVPTVAFREATLESLMKALPELADKSSEGKVRPNFVVQPGVDLNQPVTLQLSNVPFTEVLRYVGMQAGVRFQIEQYAVRVSPQSAAEAPQPQGDAPDAAAQ